VSVHKEQQYIVQSLVTMRLMKRRKCSTVAIPFAEEAGLENEMFKYQGTIESIVPVSIDLIVFLIQYTKFTLKF